MEFVGSDACMGHGPSDAFSDPKTMAANGHSPVKRKLSSYWLVVSIPLKNMTSSVGMMKFPR